MRIVHGLDGLCRVPAGSVVSIGNFDGVHLGHRRIMQTAREMASSLGAPFAVVTFEPHPITVLRPEQAPPRLTLPPVKQPLIEALAPDFLVILPPEPQVLGLGAEPFWQILRDQVRVGHLVEGPGFRLGKDAAGNVQALARWAGASSVKLHVVESVVVPLLDLRLVPVSSSLIRFLLSFGRVRDAAICLGRPYLIRGTVGPGFSRGKALGVPTANLKCDDQLIPIDAVYAGRCAVDGKTYGAAVSIGTMPTFGQNLRQVEAHLIGFDGDLYGRTLGVELLDWLREQRRFADPAALRAQMEADKGPCASRATGDAARPIAVGT